MGANAAMSLSDPRTASGRIHQWLVVIVLFVTAAECSPSFKPVLRKKRKLPLSDRFRMNYRIEMLNQHVTFIDLAEEVRRRRGSLAKAFVRKSLAPRPGLL